MENKEGIHRHPNGTAAAAADDYVTVSFDVDGGAAEDPELKRLAGELVKKSSSVVRSASSGIKKRLASLTRRPQPGRSLDRRKSVAAQALTGLKFISKSGGGASWGDVEKQFKKLTASSPNELLHRSSFGECIGMMESKQFAGDLFDALARRRNISGDSISKEELRDFWDQISDKSFDCRLQTFFDMVDKNADGRISEDEIKEIIIASASANKLTIIQEQADEYARLIMEELDPDNLGYIMIENLETLLLQGAEEDGGGDDGSNLHKLLSEKLKPAQEHAARRFYANTRYFVADNWQRLWVMAVWIAAMAALFAYKYVQYRNKTAAFEVMGHCLCMAKGAAETLKLNMALILLPMCRNTITWLRNRTRLGAVVPFDDNINFHMIVATAIGIGVGIHGISHLACDFPRLLHASPGKYTNIAKFFGEDQPTSYWHFVRGYAGVTGIVMVVLMGIAFTLASPMLRNSRVHIPKPLDKLAGFNAFWYTHHLFIIVYALLLIHGVKLYLTHEWYNKTTWMYVAVPIIIYAGERLIRAFRSSVKDVKVLKVAIYRGDANVLALQMSKPDQRFKYKSGQYIFVNCAAVSPFEWHPFSITSAPKEDYLSVHIRALGDWTKQIKVVFSEACQPPTAEQSGLDLKADFRDVKDNPKIPRIQIDGPYGAPTQDYKNYEVVLLVGLGIGATPMISVVKDIVHNIKAMEEENGIEAGTFPTPPTHRRKSGSGSEKHVFKTRRAYFYWATKEQDTFDWFKGAMNEVVEMDHKGVIEMHNYCTSVHEEGDVRSALISMLQSINHAKNGVDIVAGTRVKSHFARPNWRTVYKRIALNHPGSRVGVFYCGAPKPVVELRRLAHEFSHKTSTKFDFHKENF